MVDPSGAGQPRNRKMYDMASFGNMQMLAKPAPEAKKLVAFDQAALAERSVPGK